VRRLGEALADRHTDINGMLVRHDELGLVGSPVHLSSGGFAMRRTPPGLGADGEAVLAEFGFSRSEIEQLRADRVVA
jgi:crotonobetainyl-CoA:carnitine CoA-transferase CaiB-like acyl-CoA transferase